MVPDSSRRQFLATLGVASLPGFVSTARAADRKPALRVAHITDVHISSARDSAKGVAAMFTHMSQGGRKPDLILNSGDSVMAIDGKASAAKAQEQIDIWKQAIKGAPAPIHSGLGNHDVWNGNEPNEAIPADKKGFKLMTEVLGMPAPYYSFDQGGWHFIALNSMCQWPNYASLTKEHFDWLRDDLAKTKLPTVIYSHVPILSVTSQVYGDSCRKGNDNVVPGIWHHTDCWAISEVFRKNPHVKLCLSGHMHTCDRVEYRGVWYICGGAVSGAWWNGSEYGFPPCYGAIQLFADGTFSYDFIDYGWTARKWSGKELKG
jgi:Icc protein